MSFSRFFKQNLAWAWLVFLYAAFVTNLAHDFNRSTGFQNWGILVIQTLVWLLLPLWGIHYLLYTLFLMVAYYHLGRRLQILVFPLFLGMFAIPVYLENYMSDYFYLALGLLFSGVHSMIVILLAKELVSRR